MFFPHSSGKEPLQLPFKFIRLSMYTLRRAFHSRRVFRALLYSSSSSRNTGTTVHSTVRCRFDDINVHAHTHAHTDTLTFFVKYSRNTQICRSRLASYHVRCLRFTIYLEGINLCTSKYRSPPPPASSSMCVRH